MKIGPPPFKMSAVCEVISKKEIEEVEEMSSFNDDGSDDSIKRNQGTETNPIVPPLDFPEDDSEDVDPDSIKRNQGTKTNPIIQPGDWPNKERRDGKDRRSAD
ncbi:MAG: hypothetical protein KZQ66_21295 [Candidatus Thiodiazotropha sp. (ex Lucinoma aequizonata)]|nr:hypothetical protein [Candidatus Thiodiazotropha sp. (ex Lucinoma aequizonata)]